MKPTQPRTLITDEVNAEAIIQTADDLQELAKYTNRAVSALYQVYRRIDLVTNNARVTAAYIKENQQGIPYGKPDKQD